MNCLFIPSCDMLGLGDLPGEDSFSSAGCASHLMLHVSIREWQIAGTVTGSLLVAGAAFWWLHRKRPTADELEMERRQKLVSFGRIVDGMLLDDFRIIADDGATREMLLFQYEISGVTYECSQDITTLIAPLNLHGIKIGMPCSVRYQPGSPENSMIIAERWSGLREDAYIPWPTPVIPIRKARHRIAG